MNKFNLTTSIITFIIACIGGPAAWLFIIGREMYKKHKGNDESFVNDESMINFVISLAGFGVFLYWLTNTIY